MQVAYKPIKNLLKHDKVKIQTNIFLNTIEYNLSLYKIVNIFVWYCNKQDFGISFSGSELDISNSFLQYNITEIGQSKISKFYHGYIQIHKLIICC